MNGKVFKPYSGPLNAEQVAFGMNAARRNAERLLRDARELFEIGRWPTATLLSILSIEESGKDPILRSIAVARDESERKQLWKNYRSHTKKNVQSIFPELVRKGARNLEDFRPMFDSTAEHPFQVEALKQMATYSNCIDDSVWAVPEDVIDEEVAKKYVMTADILLPKGRISRREIELWIQHVGPVWRLDLDSMKAAVVDWHEAMQAEGLVDRNRSEMGRFIWPELFDPDNTADDV